MKVGGVESVCYDVCGEEGRDGVRRAYVCGSDDVRGETREVA